MWDENFGEKRTFLQFTCVSLGALKITLRLKKKQKNKTMKLLREREHRKFQTFTEDLRKTHMIEKYFLHKPYFIKNNEPGIFSTAIEFSGNGRVIVDTKAKLSDEVIMFNVFKKYIEFRATVEENIAPERYLLNIHTIHIAAGERSYNRYPVDQGIVSVSNFRASRNAINASLFNIPTSVKVHLKQYQQILIKSADEVTVDVFDKSKEKLEMVRKTTRILYVPDTGLEKSYTTDEPGKFINYMKSTDQEISVLIREYKDRKIVSELIVPIIYTGHDGIPIPLGYIQFVSRTKPIPREKSDELLKMGAEIVQKMRDANTVLINERQKIENISHEGMCLRITHPELQKLLPDQSGLTFDVIFKMTQPLTVSTEIIYMGLHDSNLITGLKIIGFSSKSSDSNRFYSMVDSLGS